ncbi:MAG: beta barrel protein insertion system outer membrane component BamA [Rhodobacteraceae bacterium HLUCCA12]|nr:MAG: beta barrel protein insertion system outer membrane component BamA [Rhodobacteraceae bacterium HLUCCA12]
MVSLGVSAPAEAQTYRFDSVTVQGNQQIDAETIAGFARIARNRSMSAAELNDAYQRVAGTGFFRSVDFAPSGSRLIIRVQEYPILNRVNFEGNRRVDDEDLASAVQSRSGRVYSPSQAEADANTIAEVYAEQGRLAARVTPRLIERGNGRVDLAFEIAEGSMVEIERISFVGNRDFSERRLRNAIESAQAGFLSWLFRVDNYDERRIAEDRRTLQDFYLSRGYADAEVLSGVTELTRERDGVYVTFTIREGQQYRFGSASVQSEISGIDPAPYEEALTVRSGALYSPVVIDNQIQQLERVAYQSGERFVRAEPRLTRNEREGTIDLAFALVRADRVFIERIDIEGNTTTQDNVIRREFHVAEGDPFNPREIREAASRIRELGFFSDVQVTPQPGRADDQAVVDVEVEETTTGSLGFGLSYGANDGIGGNLTYSEANFLGRGQSVSASISTLESARALEFSITEPALFDRDLAASLDIGLNSTTATSDANFATSALRVSPSLEFPLSENGRLSLRTTLMRDDIRVNNTRRNPISPRIRQDARQGRVITSSVGYTYRLDTRYRGNTPDSGFVLRFGQDIAGLGGDRRWLRSTALVGYERRVFNGDVTLRAEAEAGAVMHNSGPSRINERFNLSSDQMRGFRPFGIGPRDRRTGDGLGGNYYAVARLEAEFPLGLPQEYGITGGAFLDVGSLWGIDAPTANVIDRRGLRATAGVSLFWTSPLGPLRFNFSTPLRRDPLDEVQYFDFSIATRF